MTRAPLPRIISGLVFGTLAIHALLQGSIPLAVMFMTGMFLAEIGIEVLEDRCRTAKTELEDGGQARSRFLSVRG